MPTGPKGQKRPADVVSNAVHVMKVLTGEASDEAPDGPKSAAAMLGARGGRKRAQSLPAERRAEIAKLAAKARWGKTRPVPVEGEGS
jgi:hypothetical protein